MGDSDERRLVLLVFGVNATGDAGSRAFGFQLFAGLVCELMFDLAYGMGAVEPVRVRIEAQFNDLFKRSPSLFDLIVDVFGLLFVAHPSSPAATGILHA